MPPLPPNRPSLDDLNMDDLTFGDGQAPSSSPAPAAPRIDPAASADFEEFRSESVATPSSPTTSSPPLAAALSSSPRHCALSSSPRHSLLPSSPRQAALSSSSPPSPLLAPSSPPPPPPFDPLAPGSPALRAGAPRPPSPRRYVTPSDYSLLSVIGVGSFGKVFLVRGPAATAEGSSTSAMKVISKRLLRRKPSYIENVVAERDILAECASPFCVRMDCSFQTADKLFIIMEFAAGGELFYHLGKQGLLLEHQCAFY
ncbi:hypothetical protein TeGR_g14951, partial [Tetraparma gracilis]